ncbi:MAG: hypothetical protein L3J33_10860 [Rhodobacteraceae bacterium]|nr:hypothetical protein [Paracoccaceae bacterium]
MSEKPSTAGVASRLAAFLRVSPSAPAEYGDRPKGRLIWLHVPDDMPIGPLRELGQMLQEQFEDVSCLLSAANVDKWQGIETLTTVQLPKDENAAIDRFLNHWQPDLLLWGDPVFQARIIQKYKSANAPMFLINMPVLDLSRRSLRRSAGHVLAQFDKAQVISTVAAERLASLGFPADKISQVLPISEMAWPMPDDAPRRRAISAGLGPRPIWCCAHLRMSELSAISNAHHLARKSFPTALMILAPAQGEDAKEITRILSADGWRVTRENTGKPPDRQCEVLVANDPEKLGVWYRLASVSVMGGSLTGPASCNPFEAAALGSAVICGPITFPHGARYRQLANGDAVVRIEDPNQLGTYLTNTLAPDQSAKLATAAWTVGSEGVEALGQIIELVKDEFQPEEG